MVAILVPMIHTNYFKTEYGDIIHEEALKKINDIRSDIENISYLESFYENQALMLNTIF